MNECVAVEDEEFDQTFTTNSEDRDSQSGLSAFFNPRD
jgi:hypothetical protein